MRNAVQTQMALEAEEQRPVHGGAPNDNSSEALQQLLAENVRLRTEQWPARYCRTTHKLHLGDARELSWIADSSVHLIVTSPPYWNLKDYNEHTGCPAGVFAASSATFAFQGERTKAAIGLRRCIPTYK
jgi:hypothetical protein